MVTIGMTVNLSNGNQEDVTVSDGRMLKGGVKLTKVYLCHAISTKGEFNDSKRVAQDIRALGYDVYAAAENASINDKTNEPTVEDIYKGDVDEILSSDIVVVNLSGGHQDGTISEVGVVAGWNENELKLEKKKPIVGYSSNSRLANPQFHKGVPSAHANHLVLGMIERWGEFVGGESGMLSKLKELGG